jgi:hypothetical protein
MIKSLLLSPPKNLSTDAQLRVITITYSVAITVSRQLDRRGLIEELPLQKIS